MKTIIQFLFFIIFVSSLSWASIATVLYEIEPNNTPTEATPFSGEIVLTGMIKEGDQDAFMWKIDEKDSMHSWGIELVGVANAMTRIDIIQVIFTADGKEVKDYKKFFSFGTRTGEKPVHLNNLLLNKGKYLIAVSSKSKEAQSSAKSYKISFKKNSSIHTANSDTRESTYSIDYYFSYYKFKNKKGWFAFNIDKKASQKLWTLKGVTSIENQLEVKLEDKEGNTILETKTNKFGKYKLSDLELDEGRYYVKYTGESKNLKCGTQLYSSGTVKIDVNEIEPNNVLREANSIAYKKTIYGKIERDGDRDYFKFSLPQKLEGKLFDIRLKTDEKDTSFMLYKSHNKELQDKRADSNYTMKNLSLNSDEEYYIYVYGRQKDSNYSFQFSEFRERNSSYEAEPNDNIENAYRIDIEKSINGKLTGYEYDCFSFNIDKPNALWSLTAEGEKIGRLFLYKGLNSSAFLSLSNNKKRESSFKNLLLLPGNYRTCVKGTNAKYTLSVNEMNLSDLNISSLADIEHEPNQNDRQTNSLKIGQTIKGVVESSDNEDYFHFTLKSYEHIRITATPPKNGDVRFKVHSDLLNRASRPKVGNRAIVEGIYPPGRYIINLWSDKPNYGLYRLKLERLNFFDSMDREPNDNALLASEFPNNFNLKGYNSSNDEDFFKFPSYMNRETNVTIRGENLKGHIHIYPNNIDNRLSLKWNESNQSYTTTLKTPSKGYFVVESGTGFYDYNLSFTAYQPQISKELPLSLEIDIENKKVATYSEFGQKVTFSISLQSKEDMALDITPHISDNSWRIKGDKSISLKSNEKKRISFKLIIPNNIDKTPVITTLKFSQKNKAFKTLSFTIEPQQNIAALNPYDDWGMPKELRGGVNVARLDFGAKRVIDGNETQNGYISNRYVGKHLLFDNLSYRGEGFHLYGRRDNNDENISIELAGDKAVEVVGIILNPLSDGGKNRQLQNFSISLSMDGKDYQQVYSGKLGLESRDQAFVFDKLYKAKYAKLTLHNNYANETKGIIALGEWKVIAKKDSNLELKPFNIANPKLGGHVVHASIELRGDWDRAILTTKNDVRDATYLYKENKKISWVVGFKNERMAKISTMRWREPKGSKKESYVKDVKIFISTETPNGSWQEVKSWHKGENNISSYQFEKPVWARYIKFVMPVEKTAYYSLPDELQIFESPISKNYLSILGEWGGTTHRSFYEYQKEMNQKKMKVIQGNESKDKAFELEMNQTIQGRVSVNNHEVDWFKITVPKNHNQLIYTLSGKNSVDVTYELFDSNGTEIKADKSEKSLLKHTFKFEVKEGTYYLKIKQPPISVVFTWDNSGSVSPYHKSIFNAVNNYTQTIQPKIDAVNLLCFNSSDKFLLSDFSDKPTQIQKIFNNFNRDCSDSAAERPLRKSAIKLKDRDGIKGVIIIGDAVGGRDMKLWSVLKEVKPKVFSIRVQSQYRDNNLYEGIMQSWSRVNNGTYSVVSNGEELYRAINRASAILRRPVYYQLNAQTRYERPLGDGSLMVTYMPTKKVKVNKNFAIELILDASGSMLKRIKGKRRIAIAREVLKKAVKDVIPPKTQIALRVFGHKKADSCRTDLEMRLQPLNVKKTTRIISKINAKNLAKTPIADSLAKVADDLSSVKGKKVVILVTDGEETCDGDPAKVIQELKDKGVDVRINIVGFAIDNEALKEQFRTWARIGDGAYFEANDKKSLEEAINKALQIPYKVYKEDTLVGSGVVGDSGVKLKGGTYKVEIESNPKKVFEDVLVIGEKVKEIKLKDRE